MDAFAVCALFEGRYRYVFKFANCPAPTIWTIGETLKITQS